MSELTRALEPLQLDVYAHIRALDAGRSWGDLSPERAALLKATEGLPSEDDAELTRGLEELKTSLSAAEDQRKGLQEAYDSIVGVLRARKVDVPLIRPTNYSRSAMHITTALICLLLVEYVLSPTGMIVTAAIGAIVCWSLETGRIFSKRLNAFLLKAMSAVAHPHERRHVNSATWYTTALLVLAVVFAPKFCVVALAVLGLADPAAAFVGRRWGRVRLVNGRSLEGTTTFFVVGTLAALGTLLLWHPDVRWGLALIVALGAAFAGAVTELFSRRIDDNLSIPIAAAAGGSAAWAVAFAL